MGYALTNKTIDKYFRFLTRLDNSSKKRLIIKLTESIETKQSTDSDIRSLFGAWDDLKDSDTIIKEIRDSRVDKTNQIDF